MNYLYILSLVFVLFMLLWSPNAQNSTEEFNGFTYSEYRAPFVKSSDPKCVLTKRARLGKFYGKEVYTVKVYNDGSVVLIRPGKVIEKVILPYRDFVKILDLKRQVVVNTPRYQHYGHDGPLKWVHEWYTLHNIHAGNQNNVDYTICTTGSTQPDKMKPINDIDKILDSTLDCKKYRINYNKQYKSFKLTDD